MTTEQLNIELSELCSIPEEKRTQSDTARIYEIEAILDARTGEF